MVEELKNWAGNFSYGAARIHRPSSVEELQELVRQRPKLKALGSRHSFNDIADTSEDLVSTECLNSIVSLDRDAKTVTAQGGIKYGELCQFLYQEGYAIHNLASLPHISVAGACATGTHGSGERNGNLSTAVAGLDLVTADGQIVKLLRTQNPDPFHGAVVGIGALGVIANITLDIEPAFDVAQTVYRNLPMSQLENHLDEIEASGYSVSLFTSWTNSNVNQVWIKRRCDTQYAIELGESFFGATKATHPLHPIDDISPINCTDQMGVPGPSHERLPHFKMDFTPSSGEELQSEFLFPREYAFEALMAINKLSDRIAPLLLISEIRTVAADNLWLSASYQQDSVAVHFTWKQMWPEVRELLPSIEAALEPFNARPHWGKLFTMSPMRVRSVFPKHQDFEQLAETYDPTGKFRNAFVDKFVFGG